MYSGILVVVGEKLFYKVVFGEGGCNRAKWLYSREVVVFGQKWLYSGKLLYSDKVAVFGQKWLYRG